MPNFEFPKFQRFRYIHTNIHTSDSNKSVLKNPTDTSIVFFQNTYYMNSFEGFFYNSIKGSSFFQGQTRKFTDLFIQLSFYISVKLERIQISYGIHFCTNLTFKIDSILRQQLYIQVYPRVPHVFLFYFYLTMFIQRAMYPN